MMTFVYTQLDSIARCSFCPSSQHGGELRMRRECAKHKELTEAWELTSVSCLVAKSYSIQFGSIGGSRPSMSTFTHWVFNEH